MGHLREQLSRFGWRKRDNYNYPVTVHPNGSIAIAVASGDDKTGDPYQTPTTNSDKGPLTKQVVSVNQLSFADVTKSFPKPGPPPTWFLLYRSDEDETRVELSLPFSMDSDGYVNNWIERIILGAVPFFPSHLGLSQGLNQSAQTNTPGPVQPIDVPIRRLTLED